GGGEFCGRGEAPRRGGPPKCRTDGRQGKGRPRGASVGGGEPPVHGGSMECKRRRGGSWRGLEGAAPRAAVGHARRGRFSGDPPGGNRRHHHCWIDLGRAGACPRRSCHRALEGVRRVSAELATSEQASRAATSTADSHAPSRAARKAHGGECTRCP